MASGNVRGMTLTLWDVLFKRELSDGEGSAPLFEPRSREGWKNLKSVPESAEHPSLGVPCFGHSQGAVPGLCLRGLAAVPEQTPLVHIQGCLSAT